MNVICGCMEFLVMFSLVVFVDRREVPVLKMIIRLDIGERDGMLSASTVRMPELLHGSVLLANQ